MYSASRLGQASLTTTTTTPAGRTITAATDAQGRVTSRQLTGLDAMNFTYDARGHLSSTTQGAGTGARTYSLTYDAQGNVANITDPLARVTAFTYDPAGRVTRKTLPGGRVIDFTYDANGNVTSITPPARPAHAFTYNPVDLRSSYTAPLLGTAPNTTTYAYNLDNQLTLITRPDGRLYIRHERKAHRRNGERGIRGAYTYDQNGNRLTYTGQRGACRGITIKIA